MKAQKSIDWLNFWWVVYVTYGLDLEEERAPGDLEKAKEAFQEIFRLIDGKRGVGNDRRYDSNS